jgi:predicted small lipoprotein YifL
MMRRILAGSFVMAALLALSACGGPLKYKVASSRLAPGADADITATINESQNNTAVEVHVVNLPPAGRVNPNAKFFIAWARKGESGVWSRLGTLKFDEEKRTGDIVGTVPEQAFDLEVSAEADEGVASPSADVVFSQHVAR